MLSLMCNQIPFKLTLEATAWELAAEWLGRCVCNHVSFDGARLGEGFVTHVAGVRFLTSVHSLMYQQITLTAAAIVTFSAFVALHCPY